MNELANPLELCGFEFIEFVSEFSDLKQNATKKIQSEIVKSLLPKKIIKIMKNH